MSEKRQTLNERFTDLADIISEGMGTWPVSTVALVLIIAWTVFCAFTQGPGWWYSPFYNFPLNLVTTIAELFIGFLIAAAANRVERRHDALLEQIKAHASADLHTTEHDAETNKQAEQKIDMLARDIQFIKHMLAKGVVES